MPWTTFDCGRWWLSLKKKTRYNKYTHTAHCMDYFLAPLLNSNHFDNFCCARWWLSWIESKLQSARLSFQAICGLFQLWCIAHRGKGEVTVNSKEQLLCATFWYKKKSHLSMLVDLQRLGGVPSLLAQAEIRGREPNSKNVYDNTQEGRISVVTQGVLEALRPKFLF